jgi:glutamate synthase (NADPH/NADH) large chain
LDFSSILYNPQVPGRVGRRCTIAQDHGLQEALDNTLIEQTKSAVEHGTRVDRGRDVER